MEEYEKPRRFGELREGLFGGFELFDEAGCRIACGERRASPEGYEVRFADMRPAGLWIAAPFGGGFDHYDASGRYVGSSLTPSDKSIRGLDLFGPDGRFVGCVRREQAGFGVWFIPYADFGAAYELY